MPGKGSKRATARVCQAGLVPFALDLDGVVWLGDEPIPGAADAVARLRAAGEAVVFCTNNSNQPVAEVEAKLARQGIAPEGGVVTSAMAAAALIRPGERVLICAGPGAVEAVGARGAVAVRTGDAWAVSAVDRTLRTAFGSESAGRETSGWYLAGNAVVCDAASGLRDRGFIYGRLAAGPGPDRIELTGIPVRGDGRLVNGLYLFVTSETPVPGASYTLTPVNRDGLSARQPVELQGRFGIPDPVVCGVQKGESLEVPASIEGLMPAPDGSVLPRQGTGP